LRAHLINVYVSVPEDTRLDFEARSLPPLVRASPHYFNTSEEIACFCDAVETLTRSRARVKSLP
jgi:cysteine desulfurase / selenocysteine lyase